MLTRSKFAYSTARRLFALALSTVAISAYAQEPNDFPLQPIQSTLLPESEAAAFYSPEVDTAFAEPVPKQPPATPSFGGPLLARTKLTGDWLGARSALASDGIKLDVSNTQFYQGVTSGGLEQAFKYGGRNDYFMNLDGERLGLMKGSFVTLHGETRYGESANSLTGALMPVNLMLALPQPNGSVTALTGVTFTQFLSEDMMVYLGVSDPLKNLAPISLPLQDEHGTELYYNIGVTPWCQITPDLQVISPFRERADTSLLFGLRAKIDF